MLGSGGAGWLPGTHAGLSQPDKMVPIGQVEAVRLPSRRQVVKIAQNLA